MFKIGTMFGDVSKSLFRKPATQNYPAERTDTPSQLRGLLELKLEACTGCGLCVMDCPASALKLIMIDRKAKRFVLDYYVDRCAFCGQCVESCNRDALSMSSEEWELAALDKTHFLIHFGKPEDVEQALAGTPQSGPATAK